MKRYSIDCSLKNGLGKPSVNLYLTGCDIPTKCEGCHNWELTEQSKEEYVLEDIKKELSNMIDNFLDYYNDLYVCILGGEPLTEYNRPITMAVARFIKESYSNTKVVVYSWREPTVLPCVDFGVFGPFNKDKYVENMLPSSSNQYIWDFNNNCKINSIKLK